MEQEKTGEKALTRSSLPGAAVLGISSIGGFVIGDWLWWPSQSLFHIALAAALSLAVFVPIFIYTESWKRVPNHCRAVQSVAWALLAWNIGVLGGSTGKFPELSKENPVVYSWCGQTVWLLSTAIAMGILIVESKTVNPSRLPIYFGLILTVTGIGISGLVPISPAPLNYICRIMALFLLWAGTYTVMTHLTDTQRGAKLADKATILMLRYVLMRDLALTADQANGISFENASQWSSGIHEFLEKHIDEKKDKAKAVADGIGLGGLVTMVVGIYSSKLMQDMSGSSSTALLLSAFVISLAIGPIKTIQLQYWKRLTDCCNAKETMEQEPHDNKKS